MKKSVLGILMVVFILGTFSSCSIIGRRYSRGFFLHMSVLGAQRMKQKAVGVPQKKVAFPVITKIIADLKIRNMSYTEAQSLIRAEEKITKRFMGKRNGPNILKEKKREMFTERKSKSVNLNTVHFTSENPKNISSASFLNSSAKIVASGDDHKMDKWYKLVVWFIAIGLVWELWLAKYFKG